MPTRVLEGKRWHGPPKIVSDKETRGENSHGISIKNGNDIGTPPNRRREVKTTARAVCGRAGIRENRAGKCASRTEFTGFGATAANRKCRPCRCASRQTLR